MRSEKEKTKEVLDEMQSKITFVEDSAKSQVAYLQNRIKEVVEETSQNNQAAVCLIFTQASR